VNRAPVALAAAVTVLAAVIAACGTADPSGSTPRPASSSGASQGVPTVQPPTTFGPPPSASFDEETPAILDPRVLAYLPAAVNGIPVTEALDEAAIALSNPAVSDFASAVDAAVAVDIGNGNVVSAYVLRVKEDRFSTTVYQQWRDSFDEGACIAGGGVVGRAEAEIGGRNAYVTSCVSGMRTYHVFLEDEMLLISASSIGDARFGELLLANLEVPA
jgi:hypothetical protein